MFWILFTEIPIIDFSESRLENSAEETPGKCVLRRLLVHCIYEQWLPWVWPIPIDQVVGRQTKQTSENLASKQPDHFGKLVSAAGADSFSVGFVVLLCYADRYRATHLDQHSVTHQTFTGSQLSMSLISRLIKHCHAQPLIIECMIYCLLSASNMVSEVFYEPRWNNARRQQTSVNTSIEEKRSQRSTSQKAAITNERLRPQPQ